MDWEAFYNNFRQPDFLPGYEIQNRLGGGAFGEVYKAKKHSIGKAYAVKFLKIDDDAQREAVERELEQVRHFAAIDHPNLVTIEDLGTVMGVPYLVMGYAGEDTLARALRNKSLNAESALLYFVQACRGVLALHDRRLVHFDLKPSNIFLKGDIARVGDYGLAKMMTDGRLTLSFGRGTPQYMAPEMLKNRADQRADIYSLGVILYESVAAKLPFESDLPGAIPIREKDEPPQFPSDIPAPVRIAVERCLRLDPKDRYDSISELLTDLGQTARPGDSVRLGLTLGTPSRHVTPRDLPTPVGDRSEARTTAAELTRGAVEVARGMWDGLRTASQPARSTTPPPMPAYTPVARAPRSSDGVPEEAVVMHALSDRPPAPLVRVPIATAVATRSADATIPVPPRVAGGWFGTLAATAQLGIEVWFTLLRGLLGRVRGDDVRTSPPEKAGFFARMRRWLGRGVRLLAFLVLAALVGGLCTLAFYQLSSEPP